MTHVSTARITSIALMALMFATACATDRPPPEVPDYTRPLPYGRSALRKVRQGDPVPDPAVAWRNRDAGLMAAIDESLRWFDAPSSRGFFPFEHVTTHEKARASLVAFKELLTECGTAEEFTSRLFAEFDLWQSVGWDGSGTVLFTGYYAPEFRASTVL